MKLYHPKAVALLHANGKEIHPYPLWTYDGFESIEEARKQFITWQDYYCYTLLVTWIEDDERNIMEHEVHMNGLGYTTKYRLKGEENEKNSEHGAGGQHGDDDQRGSEHKVCEQQERPAGSE